MKTTIVNPIAETEKIYKHLALVKAIREKLIHMRCPEFFDGVSDGHEQKFDDHLKEIISITNEVINFDLPHVVGYVDDLFDEAVISHAEFNRSDMVLVIGNSGESAKLDDACGYESCDCRGYCKNGNGK